MAAGTDQAIAFPIVLTIAGSDSSAGAGIQADLKTISACSGYGASVITAVTAQNTQGVTAAAELAPDLIRAQIDAVFADLSVRAVKSGMLSSATVIQTVGAALRHHRPRHYVLDPVMISKTGFPLLNPDAVDALTRELVPLATLVTPNVHEVRALTGRPVETLEDAERAGRCLLTAGAAAVLVKGGHLRERPATDVLVTRDGSRVFAGEFIDARHTHGTGCTYSAAIATQLAHGRPLEDAIVVAKLYVTEAIRGGLPIGRGVGPTDHFFFLRGGDAAEWVQRLGGVAEATGPRSVGRLHVITDETLQERFSHFELARLAAEGGADVVQFREKRSRPTRELVQTAREMAAAFVGLSTRLVVDDRVDVALAAAIPAVHLGPDDLEAPVARTLMGPNALIGGTANDLESAVRVAATPVDYLGVGPVFGTRSKTNPAPALGLEGLHAIARAVGKPVIAIGSITPDRVGDVLAAGAHGVAVLSAVVCRPDPVAATWDFRRAIDAQVKGREP